MDAAGENWSGELEFSPGAIDVCTFDAAWTDRKRRKEERRGPLPRRALDKLMTDYIRPAVENKRARFVLRFVAGCVLGVLLERWVYGGWRPWLRTPEEQAQWCRSRGVAALLL